MKPIKSVYLVLILAVVLAGTAEAQMHESKNLSLADSMGYDELYQGAGFDPEDPDTTEADFFTTLADVASWQDPDNGKEYALVALHSEDDGSGVAMVNVTDPANITHHKTIRYSTIDSENTPHDVKVYDNIAYIGQDDNGTIPVYWVDLTVAVDDTADPTAGASTSGFGQLHGNAQIHNVHINEEHELLFLSDFNWSEEDIPVYDISNVEYNNGNPSHEGSIGQIAEHARSHDLFAMQDNGSKGLVFDASMVAVTVTEYEWDSSSQDFSVKSQRSHKFTARRGQPPNDFSNVDRASNIHSTWIGENENYLFTTIEGSSGNHDEDTWIEDPETDNEDTYQRANYLKVWDVSDIDAPADANGYRYDIEQAYQVLEDQDDGGFANAYFGELNAATNDKPTSIHNIHTKGDDAYVSYYTEGIRVLDVTDPTDMNETAFYDIDSELDPYYNRPAFNGAWGVDPYLPSGTVLGSSADGLYVFYPPGEFGGDIEVATRWTTDITVVDPLSVNEEVTVQDNNITVALEADMDLQSDIALADAELTLEASSGTRSIEAVGGTYTIGAEGQASSSAKMAGGAAAGAAEIDAESSSERPEKAELKSNYPNPFNPVTTIEYILPEEAEVRLEIYDILGRRVAVLEDGLQQAGTHQIQWDASVFSSGTYIYRLEAGAFTETRQMMLVK